MRGGLFEVISAVFGAALIYLQQSADGYSTASLASGCVSSGPFLVPVFPSILLEC